LLSHTQTKASYQEVAGEQSIQLLKNQFWGKTLGKSLLGGKPWQRTLKSLIWASSIKEKS